MAHSNPESLDIFLAIATDLLAQGEAQHRATRRLHDAARQLAGGGTERTVFSEALDLFRQQIAAVREIVESERALLEELERELAGASN